VTTLPTRQAMDEIYTGKGGRSQFVTTLLTRQAMDGYVMFGKMLVCHEIPPEKVRHARSRTYAHLVMAAAGLPRDTG
jgi:hypothetical protein